MVCSCACSVVQQHVFFYTMDRTFTNDDLKVLKVKVNGRKVIYIKWGMRVVCTCICLVLCVRQPHKLWMFRIKESVVIVVVHCSAATCSTYWTDHGSICKESSLVWPPPTRVTGSKFEPAICRGLTWHMTIWFMEQVKYFVSNAKYSSFYK